MIEPFLGEVVLFPYSFAPEGWAWCEGKRRLMSGETILFSLLKHRFGGSNEEKVFELPDYSTQAPKGLRYCMATAGRYPDPNLSPSRGRGVGEVAILAFEPRELGAEPWRRRPASPALPHATFVVAMSGDPAPPDPFIGEVRLFEDMTAPPTAPPRWVRCDGQKLQITDAQALFSLIYTNFGGDGRNNFAVPDLRSHEPPGARYFMPVQGGYPPGQ